MDLLKQTESTTDFVLTQVVSHHDLKPLENFIAEASRQALTTPLLVGVFYYRSGRPKTLEALSAFMPVPTEGLMREFGEKGCHADEVCARTIRAVRALGQPHVYLCNLAPAGAARRLTALRGLVETSQD